MGCQISRSPFFIMVFNLPTLFSSKIFQRFVNQHQPVDFLLMGFPSVKSNPFREKSSCTAL